ncbi:MAG: UDP-3-O-(3-hydroxymyristoyl)glucosamine N-acyltransferase [Gammaproteobacteria bacterium]|nr:UDP-3-O-(3-hydroxymyristoyl)glucosamine N-acyltransferase [Xanthomonadales bacterium]
MEISLGTLAKQFKLEFKGNADKVISSVGTLEKAQNHQISFLSNSKYSSQLNQTNAGIVILNPQSSDKFTGNQLISENPYVTYAKVATLLQTNTNKHSEIHPTAVIAKTAKIGKDVNVGPYSIIGENTEIGEGTNLEARVTIGNNCKIGKDCVFKPNVVVSCDCSIGDRVILHPGAIIGAEGFGLARDVEGWIKVPQLGSVRIGNDCEVGANTTIDRGTIEDTILEDDVRLDNQIQIAHNVHIGAHTVMAGCSAVAGSAKIGKNCMVGGGVGILGHLEVCDNVILQSMALVTHSIKRPGSYSSVAPIQETTEWRKSAVRFKQLDSIARRLGNLEKKIK